MTILKNLGVLFVLCFLQFTTGCKKGSFIPESKSNLRYFPLGPNIYPGGVTNELSNILLAVHNGNQVMRSDDLSENHQWNVQIDGYIEGIVANKDGGAWIVKHSPFFWEELTFCRLSETGTIIYNNTGTKMIPAKPNNQEFLMSITADGQNGVYCLIALLDFGVGPDKITPDNIYLVHANNQNQIDMRLQLNEYFLRIAMDKDGNLFGLSHNTADFTATGTGAKDTFHLVKFDNAALINKQSKKVWQYDLTVTEYYVNFYWEHNFAVKTNSKYVYVAFTTARFLDLETGIEIHCVDKTNGSVLATISDPSPTTASSYSEGSVLTGFADENGAYAAYRIGATTRLITMDIFGQKDKTINLKGNNNRCSPIGIGLVQNKLTVFGYSTKGKSTQFSPFSFQLNSK